MHGVASHGFITNELDYWQAGTEYLCICIYLYIVDHVESERAKLQGQGREYKTTETDTNETRLAKEDTRRKAYTFIQ